MTGHIRLAPSTGMFMNTLIASKSTRAGFATQYTTLLSTLFSFIQGWLNSNATLRKFTDDWAAKLSSIYPKIIQNYKFKNFDIAYYDFPLDEISRRWRERGGENWQLIEPSDGFHPGQIANGRCSFTLCLAYYFSLIVH